MAGDHRIYFGCRTCLPGAHDQRPQKLNKESDAMMMHIAGMYHFAYHMDHHTYTHTYEYEIEKVCLSLSLSLSLSVSPYVYAHTVRTYVHIHIWVFVRMHVRAFFFVCALRLLSKIFREMNQPHPADKPCRPVQSPFMVAVQIFQCSQTASW